MHSKFVEFVCWSVVRKSCRLNEMAIDGLLLVCTNGGHVRMFFSVVVVAADSMLDKKAKNPKFYRKMKTTLF